MTKRTQHGLRLILKVAALAIAAAAAGAPPPSTVPSGEGLVLRVGLETDRSELVVECCQPGLEVSTETGSTLVEARLRITPAGEASAPTFRLQAAALKDEDQSVALAARLADLTQEPADATFDVASSLYRVRVGRFASR
ncbi:MAG: SPOR domain-containing protein, partial [Acidobacteriota bacterium]|nr:SPOR domain-containing protein [Acidobacteriota bacterium]